MSEEKARIAVVTGVRREADCLAKITDDTATQVLVSGADPMRARELADQALASGAAGIVSFGLCGALDRELPAGALIIPSRIIAAGGRGLRCDPDWIGRIGNALADMRPETDGTLVHSDAIVSDPKRKAMLRANTSADAVDMESYRVGQAAKAAGRPFVVIRAVSDTADTSLPEWTDSIVSSTGGTDGIRLLKNLVMHPGDIGKLITLGRSSTKALKILSGVARRLGPGFAFI